MFFSVYAPNQPERLSPDQFSNEAMSEIEYIADKKSIWALIFPYFWLIYHKLWWELLAYGIYMLLPIYLSQQGNSGAQAASILVYLPAVLIYLESSALITYRLERKGWHFLGVVEASSQDDAAFKFLNQYRFNPTPPETIKPVEHHKDLTQKPNPTKFPSFGLIE